MEMKTEKEETKKTSITEPEVKKQPESKPTESKPAASDPCVATVTTEKYKFITYNGNHAEVVAEALHRRGNFEEVYL